MLPSLPQFQTGISLSLSKHISQLEQNSTVTLTMKQKFHSIGLLLVLLFLIISTSPTSARKLASKEGEATEKINKISSSKKSVETMENIYSFTNLMGLEECQNEDEDCTKRRVLADAHLDYIYTEHHKP